MVRIGPLTKRTPLAVRMVRPLWRSISWIHLSCTVFAVACHGSGGPPPSLRFNEPEAKAPLGKLGVRQDGENVREIFATLAQGARIDEVVDLSLFESIDPEMTLETARE